MHSIIFSVCVRVGVGGGVSVCAGGGCACVLVCMFGCVCVCVCVCLFYYEKVCEILIFFIILLEKDEMNVPITLSVFRDKTYFIVVHY